LWTGKYSELCTNNIRASAASYSKIVYNGKLPDIAHLARVDGLKEDNLLSLLGGYQCQIVCSLGAASLDKNNSNNNTLDKMDILFPKINHNISTAATASSTSTG